jgi:hypothetical protein
VTVRGDDSSTTPPCHPIFGYFSKTLMPKSWSSAMVLPRAQPTSHSTSILTRRLLPWMWAGAFPPVIVLMQK